MRDVRKRAEEGRAILRESQGMDMRSTELNEFYKMFDERHDLGYVFAKAFDFGVSVGASMK